jgi:hypothetical protein
VLSAPEALVSIADVALPDVSVGDAVTVSEPTALAVPNVTVAVFVTVAPLNEATAETVSVSDVVEVDESV